MVTGFDAAHFDLAGELLQSLQDNAAGRDFAIGAIHVGAEPLPARISQAADLVFSLPDERFAREGGDGFRLAYLAVKAQLPSYFPGFDTYIWLDGDTWVQNRIGIAQIAHCAGLADFAAHPELDVSYFAEQSPSARTRWAYPAVYGEPEASRWIGVPMINSGIFGARAASPLWAAWGEALAEIRMRAGAGERVYFSDQIPLHRLVASGGLAVYPLRAVNNWMVHAARPAIDFGRRLLVATTFPHEEIHIVHLTGLTKKGRYRLGAGERETTFRYPAIKALFGG